MMDQRELDLWEQIMRLLVKHYSSGLRVANLNPVGRSVEESKIAAQRVTAYRAEEVVAWWTDLADGVIDARRSRFAGNKPGDGRL